MKKDDIEGFCKDFNIYLMSRYDCDSEPAYFDSISQTINTKSHESFEFYIRWQPKSTTWSGDTIVVARIGFDEQRIGHGTDFLKFVLSQSQKYRYQKVVIETAATDSIRSFVKKFGFASSECGNKDCWGIQIGNLAILLENNLNTLHTSKE